MHGLNYRRKWEVINELWEGGFKILYLLLSNAFRCTATAVSYSHVVVLGSIWVAEQGGSILLKAHAFNAKSLPFLRK